jgi:hypothetical protein
MVNIHNQFDTLVYSQINKFRWSNMVHEYYQPNPSMSRTSFQALSPMLPSDPPPAMPVIFGIVELRRVLIFDPMGVLIFDQYARWTMTGATTTYRQYNSRQVDRPPTPDTPPVLPDQSSFPVPPATPASKNSYFRFSNPPGTPFMSPSYFKDGDQPPSTPQIEDGVIVGLPIFTVASPLDGKKLRFGDTTVASPLDRNKMLGFGNYTVGKKKLQLSPDSLAPSDRSSYFGSDSEQFDQDDVEVGIAGAMEAPSFASVLSDPSHAPRTRAQLAAHLQENPPSKSDRPSLEVVVKLDISDRYGIFACEKLRLFKNSSKPLSDKLFCLVEGIGMSKKDGKRFYKPTGWLNDCMVYAFGKLVMFRCNMEREDKINRVVVVDTQYTALMKSYNYNYKARAVVDLLHCRTDDTELFFFPSNLGNRHWFCAFADIVKGVICGIETFGAKHGVYLRRIKFLLDANWDLIGGSRPCPVWKVHMYLPPKMPMQKDTFNCGVYVCVFMDLIAAGVCPSALKSIVGHHNIASIRQRIAAFMDGFNT